MNQTKKLAAPLSGYTLLFGVLCFGTDGATRQPMRHGHHAVGIDT